MMTTDTINRNRINILTPGEINHYCPSFYATAPRSDVSERYAFISTAEVSNMLAELGWFPVYARESRSNDPKNRGLTRHVVRWANPDFKVNGERIELMGVNSHNRASTFEFMAAIFRLVCSNGLIAHTGDLASFKMRHVGEIGDQVQEAVKQISGAATIITDRMNDFKTIDMSPDEQGIFAATALNYVYPENAPIEAKKLLTTRRSYDTGTDLWTTYNKVQENLMKGGLRGVKNDPKARRGYRRTKTRAIKSIEKDVKLNKALWTMAEQMAELKKAG